MLSINIISSIPMEISPIEFNEDIMEFDKIATIEDPVFWLSIGLFICILSGIIFTYIIRSRIEKWNTEKLSPVPLANLQSLSSWISFYTGLTIIFSSALNIFNFSIDKAIIFSFAISLLFGISMWNAIKDLLNQIKAGEVKEIDDFM